MGGRSGSHQNYPNLKQQYSSVNKNGRTMFMLQHPQNLSPQFRLGFQTAFRFSINGASFILFLKSGSTCAQQSRCLPGMWGSCHIITEGRHGKDLCADAVREAVLFKSWWCCHGYKRSTVGEIFIYYQILTAAVSMLDAGKIRTTWKSPSILAT